MDPYQQRLLNDALTETEKLRSDWSKERPTRDAELAMASAMLTDAMVLYEKHLGPQHAAMITYQAADRYAIKGLNIEQDEKRHG